MITLHFSIKINASKDKVWNILWDDANYRAWTSVFSEGSYAVSDWKEGGKIQFLSPDGSGMYSTIAQKIPGQFMSFRHVGEMKNGIEEPLTEETKKWSGAMENYTLKESGGTTELIVDLDVTEDFQEYFKGAFPKAMAKVKELSEK